MIISLADHRPRPDLVVSPLDFYRFQHRLETVTATRDGRRIAIERPLWIVGVSPFDPVIADDEGLVVHLGAPRFTARWTMRAETIASLAAIDYEDEDLELALYDTALLDPGGPAIERSWLVEAACAVAYSMGLIALADPIETH